MKKKLLILGKTGMVGSSILRLASKKFFNILSPSRKELDLFDKKKVQTYFRKQKPDIIILAAARVGGIYAKFCSGEFIVSGGITMNGIVGGVRTSNGTLAGGAGIGFRGGTAAVERPDPCVGA